MHSQVLGIRTWHLWEGHYSAYHICVKSNNYGGTNTIFMLGLFCSKACVFSHYRILPCILFSHCIHLPSILFCKGQGTWGRGQLRVNFHEFLLFPVTMYYFYISQLR